jgi:hypothetical protein
MMQNRGTKFLVTEGEFVMRRNRYLFIVGAALFIALVSFVTSAEAKSAIKVGPRVGYYIDAGKLFLGGDLLMPIANSIYFNPNVEYVLADGFTYMTFNADFHYDFPSRKPSFVWLGAGVGGLYVNPEGPADGTTDLGLNLLAGVGLSRGPTIPYLQGKVILSDNTEFVIGFGLRF